MDDWGSCFEHVVVDEAGQGTEPSIVCPLVRCSPDGHLVLVGDTLPLPPTVLSQIAEKKGLGVLAMLRLEYIFGIPSSLLSFQYRMAPSILVFPNSRFYMGRLSSDVKTTVWESQDVWRHAVLKAE